MTNIRRVLQAVSAQPWAILPSKAEEILAVLELRAAGMRVSDEEIAAAMRSRSAGKSGRRGGVGILSVHGIIAQRMDLMTAMSGGVSTESLARKFDAFVSDPKVSAIVLNVDSPGGSVYGVEELADKIRAARGQKPIIVVSNSLMASAAYWIGAQADRIVVTLGGQVGSIGVIAVHQESERMAEMAGVRFTVFSKPEAKKEGNEFERLTDEARANLERTVSDYYDKFIAAVAAGRRVRPDIVRGGYGVGRVLTAERALAEGMVDDIATLDEVLIDFGVDPASVPEPPEPRLAAVSQSWSPILVSLTGEPLTLEPGNVGELSQEELLAAIQAGQRVQVGRRSGSTEDDGRMAGTAGGDAEPARVENPAPTAPEAREESMSDKDTAAPTGAAEDGAGKKATVVTRVGVDREEANKEIAALCEMHGIPEMAGSFIVEGKSVEGVKDYILEQVNQNLKPMTAPVVDLGAAERREYSVCRLILAAADNDRRKAPLEFEISDEIRGAVPKHGKDRDGVSIWVPYNIGATRLTTSDSGKGPEGVFDVQGEFIELLRNQLKVGLLGARMLTGLRGDVKFPKQTGAATASWVSENPGADVAESAITLIQVALEPKTLQSTTSYTRQLLAQETIDVEQLVRSDLAFNHAEAIDLAAIAGTGANDQPRGILNTSGVGSVATGGAAPTWDHIVDLETAVAAANAQVGPGGYLGTAQIRGALKKTAVLSNTAGIPVWGGGADGGRMNGYRAEVSNNVPSSGNLHTLLFGIWNQLFIGFWTAFELIVDPFSLKKRGVIEVTSFQMTGVALRHAEAFAAMTDALVSQGS